MAATAATTAPAISSVRPPAWTVSCRSADRLLARPTSAGIVGGLLGYIGRSGCFGMIVDRPRLPGGDCRHGPGDRPRDGDDGRGEGGRLGVPRLRDDRQRRDDPAAV